MAGHPGCDLPAMIDLALYLKRSGYRPDKVQDFISVPMDIATCMYYTGIDPTSGREVFVPKGDRMRRWQRAVLQYFKPENHASVRGGPATGRPRGLDRFRTGMSGPVATATTQVKAQYGTRPLSLRERVRVRAIMRHQSFLRCGPKCPHPQPLSQRERGVNLGSSPMFTTDQYELLDFGDGRRLERFGDVTLDRLCPAAEGLVRADPAAWQRADARFDRGDGQEGQWTCRRPLPETWTIAHGPLVLELKRTVFGHLGVFPGACRQLAVDCRATRPIRNRSAC